MFVIAQNLSDMRVETAIDEADVGRLQLGQEATFTVDAFPGKRFKGTVNQVRKAAQVVSNVVTYTVVVSAANPDLILLPGMTANVRIVTAQKDKVLKIANAALRYRPPSSSGDDKKSAPAGRQPGGKEGKSGKGNGGGVGAGKLWVLDADGKPSAIEVKTGISDGSQTELLEGELAEGREVIVGTVAVSKPKVASPRMF
jgi:HlyD family secretion protein